MDDILMTMVYITLNHNSTSDMVLAGNFTIDFHLSIILEKELGRPFKL
jgi:hypothetical protein